ncbi:MAG: beta-phosphoglucomutase [Lacrimispora sp.]|uniref:beta-phosphoglucomutase n=1 Tax=Lacrimispora sp. TaxID=2719234 RepID=UPI0039E64F3A
MREIKTCIFDMDGVICDTAKYHFYAWKKLGDRLGIVFTEQDNERLKGVSRMESLEILLSLSDRTYTEEEKLSFAKEKNENYVDYISAMDKNEILPGVLSVLEYCKKEGIKTALGSVSKNAGIILDRLKLWTYFDAVIDGTKVVRAKPDPEVFLKGAAETGTEPSCCVVFEDAYTGVEAARAAGMLAVGIGSEQALPNADFVIRGFEEMSAEQLMNRIRQF